MSCSRRVAAGLTQYSCCRKKLLRG
jgi:hypothetical protein